MSIKSKAEEFGIESIPSIAEKGAIYVIIDEDKITFIKKSESYKAKNNDKFEIINIDISTEEAIFKFVKSENHVQTTGTYRVDIKTVTDETC